MIVVRLCGGLGNQLFQYATGRRRAYVHQTELVLDVAWYSHIPESDTPRSFELNQYPLKARPTQGQEILWSMLQRESLLQRFPSASRPWKKFRERNFDFDESVLNLNDNTYLEGYWQSYRYFEDIADIIRSEVIPLFPPASKDEAVRKEIAATQSVSVHVRRGDYISHKIAATVHGTCSSDYYRMAMAKVSSAVRNPHFFVFADDIEWARKQLISPFPIAFVDHNGAETAFQDLRLMSLCKHHIIANSSFSWWGAWLNPSKEKIVVAPGKWFADGRPTPTLIPDVWIRL